MNFTIVDKARMLRGAPLFSEVSTEVLADLAALSTIERHEPGTTLFHEGEPAEAFFLVIEGEVRTERQHGEALGAGPGDEFGALAVLDERPRASSAITTEASLLLRIDGEDFVYLLEQHPRLSRGVIRHLAHEVRTMRGKDRPQSTPGV